MNLADAMAFVTEHRFGVLMTIQPDGRPHASKIMYATADDSVVRVSITDDRIKTRNVRRDPRVGLFVAGDSPWEWVVIEGQASLSPVTTQPGDVTGRALRDYYRTLQGEHPDWEDFDQAMVDERRLVLTLEPTSAYGQLPD